MCVHYNLHSSTTKSTQFLGYIRIAVPINHLCAIMWMKLIGGAIN